MYYNCNNRPFWHLVLHSVRCELNYRENISLTVLDHIVHMSSSNSCSHQRMNYRCNHCRFGNRRCINRVQSKLSCVLYIHTFCEEQLPLHWQLTISMMTFGGGKSSVVCDTKSPLVFLQNPFCSGLRVILSHILAWTWTRRTCCFRVPDVDGSLLLSAICLQNMRLISIPLGQ